MPSSMGDPAVLHLAAIVESSDDAIVSKSLEGTITSWNRAAVRMFGYEESEALGRSIRMLIPPDRQREEDEVLARIRCGQSVDHFETVRIRKDGSCIDISLTVSPILDGDGKVIGASKIARDITERKGIEVALEAAETRARLLAAVGEVLARSSDHREMLGGVARLLMPSFADRCVAEILRPDGTCERLPSDVPPGLVAAHVIRTGSPVVLASVCVNCAAAAHAEKEHCDEARQHGLASLISLPLETRTGLVGAITFATAESRRTFRDPDVRFAEAVAARVALAIDNAKAYEEAREANRLKDDFLATLSHELRTPLNAILGYTRMLQTHAIAAERHEAALDVVERNARALAQIVDDLLDVSRVVAGKLAMRVQPVMLSRLVDDSVATVLPAAQAKGVAIAVRVGADVRAIAADPDRLGQVLWNLLSNAVKFTSRGGRVSVEVERVGDEIDIVVADTGEGIPSEFLPYVFDRFRQGDSRMAGVRGGLGIGLAIARHIVEMHGGTIEVASDGVDKGSTFRLRLPAHALVPDDNVSTVAR